jgi:hypothetical protein
MKVLVVMTIYLVLVCSQSHGGKISGENVCYQCYKDCQDKGAEICYYRCPSRTHFGRLLGLCYEMCIMGHMERCMRKGDCVTSEKKYKSDTKLEDSIREMLNKQVK